MKKHLVILLILLSTILVLGFNSQQSIAEISNTIHNSDNTIKSTLTIADLDWVACDISRDLSLSFSPSSSGGYSSDQTATSLHIRESTGTYLLLAGFYTSFSTSTSIFTINFEAKAKAGHMEALNLNMAIYNNQTKAIVKEAHLVNLGESIYFPESLETPYFSINDTVILEDFTEVLLFFYYSDGFVANWNHEFWIDDLVINTDVDQSSLPTEKVTEIISSPNPSLYGIFWKDSKIFCGTNGDIVEFNPTTETIITVHDVHLIGDITFDGTNFWTSASHTNHDFVQKFDSSFGSAQYFYLSFTNPGGITFDGTNLWIGNHVTDTIYEVNPSTGSIISSIPAPGTRVRGLQFFDDYLWVADSDAHQFYKISRTDGTIIETYDSAFNYPIGITVDDEGYIWLSSIVSNLIYKTNVNTISDFISPAVIPSDALEYELGSVGNFISWVLEDANPDTYEIYRDGTITTLATSWTDGHNVTINVDLLTVGVHNYTLVAKDSYDNAASSTIWVIVTDPDETSFGWSFVGLILTIPIVLKFYRRMRK